MLIEGEPVTRTMLINEASVMGRGLPCLDTITAPVTAMPNEAVGLIARRISIKSPRVPAEF